MTDENETQLLATAHALADAARTETLRYFRRPALNTENKAAEGFDPVTEADRAAEAAMRAILDAQRPQDGILGEEFGNKASQNGLTWVLDPIDGTRGFLAGTPTWGVLIAASTQAGPKIGIIDQPYIGERFVGGGGQAFLQGPHGRTQLNTRETDRLSDAILFSTFPEVGTPDERKGFEAVAAQVRLTRYGTDCYAYGLLALGQIDLVIEAGLHPYDIHAPIAVIEAAGGIVTNWRGGPAHDGGRIVAAANPALHRQALDVLQSIPE